MSLSKVQILFYIWASFFLVVSAVFFHKFINPYKRFNFFANSDCMSEFVPIQGLFLHLFCAGFHFRDFLFCFFLRAMYYAPVTYRALVFNLISFRVCCLFSSVSISTPAFGIAAFLAFCILAYLFQKT